MATDTHPVAYRVDDVHHKYGRAPALHDVSCTFPAAMITGLIGANGSGKTTLLRAMSGILRPTAGSITLFGEPLHARDGLPQGVGACIDGFSLWPTWSVAANLNYLARLAGRTRADVARSMDVTALSDVANKRVRHLSLGNRQRALLAAAHLTATRTLILDEPMNGLDPVLRERVRQALQELAASGVTVVLSSHDLHEIQSSCTHVVQLDQGNLIYQGSVEHFARGTSVGVLQLRPEHRADAMARLSGAGVTHRLNQGEIIVSEADSDQALLVLQTTNVPVAGYAIRTADLEETFHATR